MKHLKRFNESNDDHLIEQILNIARDEGLAVTTPQEADELGWTDEFYYIDNYLDTEEPDDPQGDPLLTEERFKEIVRDVYRRLCSLGIVNETRSCFNQRDTEHDDGGMILGQEYPIDGESKYPYIETIYCCISTDLDSYIMKTRAFFS